MKLPRRTKAVIWGLGVGTFFTCGWFWVSHSAERGEPMLLPGQSRLTVVFEEWKIGALIFMGTGIPVTLLVGFRPRRTVQFP